MKNLCLLFLILAPIVHADFVSVNDFGVTFTNNANYESSNKDSDFIFGLQTKNTYKKDRWNLGIKFGIQKYSSETLNDNFYWDIGGGEYYALTKSSDIYPQFHLLGTRYFNSPIGTTDFNYHSIGFLASASYINYINDQSTFEFTPGIDFRKYTASNAVGGRRETSLFVRGNYDQSFEIQKKEDSSADIELELGHVASNDTYYIRNYFLLGTGFQHSFTDELSSGISLNYKISSYPNRVSTTQVLANRKGRGTSIYTTQEVQKNTIITIDSVYKLYTNWSLIGGMIIENQNSSSGLYDYKSFSLFLKTQVKL